jgi:hypothetical protein
MANSTIGIHAVRAHLCVSEEFYNTHVWPHRHFDGVNNWFFGHLFFPSPRRNCFSIQGSLKKLAGDGYDVMELAGPEDVPRAIANFHARTGLDLTNASVTLIEFGVLSETLRPSSHYFPLITNRSGYKTKPYDGGRYLKSKETDLVIYDKRKQLVDVGYEIFDQDATPLTKIELRLKKKLKDKLASWQPGRFEFAMLADPNVSHFMGRLYESYVIRLLNLNHYSHNRTSELTKRDYIEYAAEQLRLRHPNEYDELLGDILDQYSVEDEMRSRITRQLDTQQLYGCGSEVLTTIKEACDGWYQRYPVQMEASAEAKEFTEKVRRYTKKRKETRTDCQIARALKALDASPLL